MNIEEIKEAFLEESQEYMEILIPNLETMLEVFPVYDHAMLMDTYRAAHSIKGTAGFLALTKISELAKAMEHLLLMIRDKELEPAKPIYKALIKISHKLEQMIQNLEHSAGIDITEELQELALYA